MTATLYRIYKAMPQELTDAEGREAVAIHVAELRAGFAANRAAQEVAKVGVFAPLTGATETTWRIWYAVAIAGLVLVWGVYEWSVF